MEQAVAISTYKPMLEQIAFRILQCRADAQDVVQETFLKWMNTNHRKIKDTKAYLIRSVTNNCFKHLDQARIRMTRTIETLPVGSLAHYLSEMDFSHLDLDEYLERAMGTIHLRLEPLERAVFLLREAFELDYDAMAAELGRRADHCRKLFSRARFKLSLPDFHFPSEMPDVSGIMETFLQCSHSGDPASLIRRLVGDLKPCH